MNKLLKRVNVEGLEETGVCDCVCGVYVKTSCRVIFPQ